MTGAWPIWPRATARWRSAICRKAAKSRGICRSKRWSGWGACLNGSLILDGKEFSPIGGWIYNRRTADEANRELGVANWKPGDFNAYDASDYGFWPEVLDRLMGKFGISFSEDGYERYRERETLAFALGDVCRAAWRKLNIRDYQPYQAYLKEGREEA